MQLINLETKILGRNCIYYKNIDSTQNEIWRLYEAGCENGTLVMAENQTDGKGTHGRKWYTDEPNNIAFSVLIKTDCDVRKLEGITTEIAKIIIQLLKENHIIAAIKEPNDIILNQKKIGGILTQSKVIKENTKCLVIGIGLNICQKKFAKEIENIATSIKKETGKEINNKLFIAQFCNKFEEFLIKKQII